MEAAVSARIGRYRLLILFSLARQQSPAAGLRALTPISSASATEAVRRRTEVCMEFFLHPLMIQEALIE